MRTRLRACRPHRPDSDAWVDLKRGARLRFERKPTDYKGWIWCTSDRGVSAWVPESWVKINGEKCFMLRDYVSRELTLDAGDEVTAGFTESGWAWVSKDDGTEGWAPLECLEEI